MQIHTLKRRTKIKKRKIVGRGGKRGTTSGRGTKGQKARAGRKLRPEMRDIIKKIPKQRGYRFKSFAKKPVVVNISALESAFENGETVTPILLVERGLIKKKGGRVPRVKILGNGDIKKKIKISDCILSKTASKKLGV